MGSGGTPLAITTRSSKARGQMSEIRCRKSGVAGFPASDFGLPVFLSLSLVLSACCWRPALVPLGGLALGGMGRLDQADRAIRTGQLHPLLGVHIRPINVVVFHGSHARPGFEGGFPLRCFQRLSRPHLATRRCGWRHNRSTRGASIPVLSY
jgi:hypothetical protein